MSDPQMNEDELNELEKLRASYRAATRDDAPSEFLDARIRKQAREEFRNTRGQRNFAVWSGVIGLAAAIGFAVVLVPAVLIQEPAPSAQDPAQFEVYLQERSVAGQSVEEPEEERMAAAKTEADEKSAQRAREAADDATTRRQARQMVATPPAPTEPSLTRLAPADLADSTELAEAALAPAPSTLKQDVLQSLNAVSANGELDMEALRAELAQAPEPEWRATLVALRDSRQRFRAEELLPEYREKFDLPETLTLDQLVVDAGGSQ